MYSIPLSLFLLLDIYMSHLFLYFVSVHLFVCVYSVHVKPQSGTDWHVKVQPTERQTWKIQ